MDETRSRVLTRDGDFIQYEALLLAPGARVAGGRGSATLWMRGREGSLLVPLLRELELGSTQSVAFIVPRGAAWPIDAYEPAFIACLAARRAEPAGKILFLTAEARPVEAFGAAASARSKRSSPGRASIS